MENKEILRALKAQQPQLRKEFWAEINEILREDSTQTCTNSEGTKIRMTRDSIIIESGISSATLTELMGTGYLTSATEEGRICIQQISLGRSE